MQIQSDKAVLFTDPSRQESLHAPKYHFQDDELIYGGGDDDNEDSLWETFKEIGLLIWWILCCPCALCYVMVQDAVFDPPRVIYNAGEDVVEHSFTDFIAFIKKRAITRSLSVEFYDQMEVFLKSIIFELKKLEESLQNSPPETREKIRDRIKTCLTSLSTGSGACGPGRYNYTLREYRALVSHSETPYNRLLTMTQEFKEEIFVEEFRGEIHSLNSLKKRHGKTLGLNRDPVLLQDPFNLPVFNNGKKSLEKHFTKERLLNVLLMKINAESDTDKELFTRFLHEVFDRDAEFRKIRQDGSLDAEDAYTSQYQTKEGFTPKAVALFFEQVEDEEGHKLSDLFNPDGSIHWPAMQAVPKAFDYAQIAQNIPLDTIRLEELKEIWARTCKENHQNPL